MNRIESIMKPLTWFMALLVVAVAAGCSSGSSGSSSSAAVSSAKAITAYSLAGTTGTIDESAKTITVAKPSGAGLTALVATFTTTGASVKVGTPAVMQVSGATPNDFRTSKVYTVTAADGTTATYTVTVTVASTTTVLPGVAGTPGANATNPTVNSANPSNADTNVPTSTRGDVHTDLVATKLVVATFDEAMDPTTINSATPGALLTFSLKETVSGTNVPGTVAMNGAHTIATFTPSAVALSAGISYTATITTAAKNAGGIAIPKSVAWSFTTRAASSANQASPFVGQAPIDLLSAGNFAILSSSPTTGITETGTHASVIAGNVGLSPGPAAAIGVYCSEVGINTIYGVDAGYTGEGSGFTACFKGTGADITLVSNAVGDMGTAYGEASGRTNPDATNVVGATADIGGLTFYPGLYKYTSATSISTNVTLDAQGDHNAVWIFQISGDLTVPSSGTLPGIEVKLINGAKASNVFWQVAGSSFGTTIGTYNTFNGNILSSAQVILQTGTVLNGRALAATAVVLDANPVTQPAP